MERQVVNFVKSVGLNVRTSKLAVTEQMLISGKLIHSKGIQGKRR